MQEIPDGIDEIQIILAATPIKCSIVSQTLAGFIGPHEPEFGTRFYRIYTSICQARFFVPAAQPAQPAPGPALQQPAQVGRPAAVVRGFVASGAENTEVRQSTVVHLTKRGGRGYAGASPPSGVDAAARRAETGGTLSTSAAYLIRGDGQTE